MQVGTRQPQPGKNNKQTQLNKNKTRAKPKSNKESLNSENNNAIPGAIERQEVPSQSGVGQSKTADGKQANNVKPSSRPKQKEIADEASKQEETAYERLYKKVQENRAARGLTMTNDHQEGDRLNQSFDGIQVNVDASDDDFMESDDELDDITRLSGRQSQESQCNQNSIAVNRNEPSTSTTKEDKFRAWQNDPDFKDFVTEVWTNMNEKNASTGKDKGNNRRKVVKPTIPHKSPSDTTIYKFCEGVCIDSETRRDCTPQRMPEQPSDRRSSSSIGRPVEPDAKKAAENLIVDSEQYKANIHLPAGINFDHVDDRQIAQMLKQLEDDDDFFNITCHIDPQIKTKIEQGEFVDVEELLPKEPTGAGGIINIHDESKVELISKGDHTYFKPVKETQINGLRKWELAFRVYAAIYSQAQPNRAVEIWQYMHVINVAVSAYQWSNVAYYDLTFRQLMAFQPECSWAKTYNQGWNPSMKEPLGNKYSSFLAPGQLSQSFSNNAPKENNHHDWRDDCCWRYNKNRCKRSAEECYFDHRCTYCGGWNHGFYNCRKHHKKDRSGNGKKRKHGGNSPNHKQN